MFRIGWLAPGPSSPAGTYGTYDKFRQREKELGYVEGKNLTIDYRGSQSVDEGKTIAEEFVRSKVDLISGRCKSQVGFHVGREELPRCPALGIVSRTTVAH